MKTIIPKIVALLSLPTFVMFGNAQSIAPSVRQIYDIPQIGAEPSSPYIQIAPDYFGIKLIYEADAFDAPSLKQSNESIRKHIKSVNEAMLKESKDATLRMSCEKIGEVEYIGPEIFFFLPELSDGDRITVFCLVPLDAKKSELDNLKIFLRLIEIAKGIPRSSRPLPNQPSKNEYEFKLFDEIRYPILAARSKQDLWDKLKIKIDAMIEGEANRLPSFNVYKMNLTTYPQLTKASLLSLYFSAGNQEIVLEKK